MEGREITLISAFKTFDVTTLSCPLSITLEKAGDLASSVHFVRLYTRTFSSTFVVNQPGKNMVKDIPIPRYDFYQTPNELILALYIKGYDKVRDEVKVEFGTDFVSSSSTLSLNLPAIYER